MHLSRYYICKTTLGGAVCWLLPPCSGGGGQIDRLTEVQLENLVTKEDLVKVTGKHCLSGTYAFWYPEGEMSKTELETGQDIRLKTKGDGPFICKFDVQQSLEN